MALTGVVLPLIKPMTMTVLILNALWIWNDFQMPLIILNKDPSTLDAAPVQYNFKSQYTFDYNMAFASYLVAMVPVMIAYACAQKYIVAGFAGRCEDLICVLSKPPPLSLSREVFFINSYSMRPKINLPDEGRVRKLFSNRLPHGKID